MKFDHFISMLPDLPFFDLAMVVQLSGESREKIRMQLYRWCKDEKVLSLRRGMYALADRYRRVPVHPADLANQLYHPSYLSGLWALSFYGLIPEMVVTYTSVTTRVPRRFQNAFGTFQYFNIKQPAFFGYRVTALLEKKVRLADPEKALLDLWHLEKGAWTQARMAAMRFQNTDSIDAERLLHYATRFESPRLLRAVEVWNQWAMDSEGTVVL